MTCWLTPGYTRWFVACGECSDGSHSCVHSQHTRVRRGVVFQTREVMERERVVNVLSNPKAVAMKSDSLLSPFGHVQEPAIAPPRQHTAQTRSIVLLQLQLARHERRPRAAATSPRPPTSVALGTWQPRQGIRNPCTRVRETPRARVAC
jgi:hypothetical protein